MPIAWKTGALWGCPSISKKALDIPREKGPTHGERYRNGALYVAMDETERGQMYINE